jgi:lysozyme
MIYAMNYVKKWIKKCESLKLQMYMDTKGNPTIGWGRNLKNGITLDEAELMFQNDFEESISELEACNWYPSLPYGVKCALVNMNFNLGIKKFLEFKKMIAALIEKNYTLAAQEVLNSLWATQVGQRAKDVAVMISEGK